MEMRTYLLLPMLLVFSAACQDHATPTVPPPVGAAHDMSIGLDRLAVPAVQVLRFELAGFVDQRWIGNWIDPGTGAEGAIEVAPVSFQQRGETVHLVQTWLLHPPDPVIPPDPVFPPDPIQLTLTGILNLSNGQLALNLHPPDPIHPPDPVSPHRVHVRGTATTSEGGLASVIGELMFNPQPEPPELSPGVRTAMTNTLTAALEEFDLRPDASMSVLRDFFQQVDARRGRRAPSQR